MQVRKVGKSYLLLCSKNVCDAVRRISETNYDEDAVCLSKAANVVRNEMLKHKHIWAHVSGEQQPSSLLALK